MDDFYNNYGEYFDFYFCREPPYFLSNGGITCQNGKMVNLSIKAVGISLRDLEVIYHQFNTAWLSTCRKVMKPNGTIIFPPTLHAYAIQ